ncbi:MAG TPA: aconitate hydratase, partial [Candidatus Handelsmanbacteria bacterium]|nr:aconitate hydratase [Candidatus Handelsmanbacteria bacterium]
AYAIAGTVDIDLQNDAIGQDAGGNDVFLRDIWPSDEEIRATMSSCITPDMFRAKYADVTEEPRWDAIEAMQSEIYDWKPDSTYIRLPTFFQGIQPAVDPIQPIDGARVLLKLGDSVTTDHISPAGAFPADGPAGQYLIEHGVEPKDFNSFGSRRGNHEVMMRGTFANVRVRNELAPGTEGSFTTYLPTGELTTVYDAAMRYIESGTPLVVLGGSQYGTGSSRDWAAKGTLLLGVKAVITTSFERIHRSNLVGMGVLPLCFADGTSAVTVTATDSDGNAKTFDTVCRIDTPVEVDYYRNGGILHTVVRNLAS